MSNYSSKNIVNFNCSGNNHVFSDWRIVKKHSCTEDGEYERVCQCGKRETRKIPSHGGHIPGAWETVKEPTEGESGLMVRNCLVCGERLEKEKIPALPAQKSAVLKVSEGLNYRINDDDETCCITGQGTCKDRDIVIPEVIDGYCVTGIATGQKDWRGQYSSDFDTNITSVVIPDSVISIGESAFYNCQNLTSVKIPNSVKSIGWIAFSRCQSLTSVVFLDSVTNIGGSAFSDCTSLTSVVLPDSVTSIGNGAFSGCTSLTSVVLPNSVTSIDGNAFSCCTSLSSVKIPDSVTSIGNRAFYNCQNLTSVKIPNSVTSIGESAFSYCYGLTNIVVPDSVKNIGSKAFENCTGLTSITLPNDIFGFSGDMLSGCKSLRKIPKLPSAGLAQEWLKGSLVVSGRGKCNDRDIVIPNYFKRIGYGAFSGTQITSIVIPDSVTSIDERAFNGCTNLTSIKIPNSVTSIGFRAFYQCTSLSSVEIPDSVTSIDESVFGGCKSLTTICYTGTKKQWKEFKLDKILKKESSVTTVQCADGEVRIRR